MGVGSGVGRAGAGVEVGDAVSRGVGALDGVCVGASVGAIVGVTVGAAEGGPVGTGGGDCEETAAVGIDLSKAPGTGSIVVGVCARDAHFDCSRCRA